MSAYVEMWSPAGSQLVRLEEHRATIGKEASSTVCVTSDPTVSAVHAIIERLGSIWSIRDVGSSNGTYVNGARISGERRLRSGDEIRVGRTRLVYRSGESEQATRTEAAQAPPELTRRERDVLLALCRPILSGEIFTEPAAVREIAEELVVTENAVKHHLLRLYDKFGIDDSASRRGRLANDAILRGAVSVADLRATERGDEQLRP